MVLIHGLQNSVMDIKKRKLDFYKDVLDVVKNTETRMEMFSFFVRQVHKLLLYIFFNTFLI